MNARLDSRRFPLARWTHAMALGLCFLVWQARFLLNPVSEFFVDLDPSWRAVLNDAFLKGRQFGTDLIFTFGPWGFLYGPEVYPENLPAFATFRIVLSGTLFFASVVLSRGIAFVPARYAWLCVMALVTALEDQAFYAAPLMLAISYVLVANKDLATRAATTALALIAAWASLTKFGALLCAVPVVGFIALDSAAQRRDLAPEVVAYVFGLLAFWSMANQSLLGIAPFLWNGLAIASGYRAMSSAAGTENAERFALSAALYVAVLLICFWREKRAWGALAGAGLLGGLLFLVGKAGFVRHSGRTAHDGLLLFFLSSLPLFWDLLRRRSLGVRLAAGLVFLAALRAPLVLSNVEQEGSALLAALRAPRRAFAAGLGSPSAKRLEETFAQVRSSEPIPEVSGTVDLYPSLQIIALAHRLDYNPRPVFQSYSAYTPQLAAKNARHLEGRTAPDSILFDILPIDDRLPALEDGPSWPGLLTRYEPRGRAGRFLALRRRSSPSSAEFRPLGRLTGSVGQSVGVPSAGHDAIWATIKVSRGAFGTLWGIVLKNFPVLMRLSTANGGRAQFRFVPEMGEAGLLISPLVEHRDDFEALYGEASFRRLDAAKAVTEFVLDPLRQVDLAGPIVVDFAEFRFSRAR